MARFFDSADRADNRNHVKDYLDSHPQAEVWKNGAGAFAIEVAEGDLTDGETWLLCDNEDFYE